MSGNVISINGESITPPGEVNPKLVDLLKSVLTRAESGDLQGVVISLYHSDDTHSWNFAGNLNRATIGNIELMKHRVIQHMIDNA